MNIDQELQLHLFQQREEQIQHADYQKEFSFYQIIASGNLQELQDFLSPQALTNAANDLQHGKLSKNPIQNQRYHFVVLTALITRLCVENGLDHEQAYTLSDLYINKMDICTDISAILTVQRDMLIAFTKKMANLRKQQVYSIQVVKAIDYIYAHLHERINTSQLAEELGLNRSYLSSLFHKETGKTITQFIGDAKLTAVSNMLKFSDYHYSEIAEYFGFASQSHFIKFFKDKTGYTPHQFRTHYINTGEFTS